MDEKFYQRLKERRNSKGLTQKQLAEVVSISPTSLAAYEKGTKTPPVDVAARIAKQLEVSIDWLFGLEEDAGKAKAKNYADIVRLFLSVADTNFDVEIKSSKVYWQDANMSLSYEEEAALIAEESMFEQIGESKKNVTIDYASIRVCNRELSHFFEAWGKLYALYKNGDIDAEMYGAWIEKKLEELKDKPLPQWQ